MKNSKSKLEHILDGIDRLSSAIRFSRFNRKKKTVQTEKTNPYAALGTVRTRSSSSDLASDYERTRELHQIVRKEEIKRRELNSTGILCNSTYDKGICALSVLNIFKTASDIKKYNVLSPYLTLYNCIISAYSYKTSEPNYKPTHLDDKINKFAIPLAAVIVPATYYTYTYFFMDRPMEFNDYFTMLFEFVPGFAKTCVDLSRRKNEKIVKKYVDGLKR